MMSTPRVRCVSGSSSRLLPELKRKWERKIEWDFPSVLATYLRMAEKCMWWRHVVRNSPDKKKRRYARKCFTKLYPEMMALTQMGLDDHIPFSVPMKLDRLYFKLNQR